MKNKWNILFYFLGLCLLAISVSSCGSGGSSGSSAPVGDVNGQPVGTGSVAILLTDDPSNDFAAIHITITKIELLSDDGRFTVFSGRKTVNLLDLKNETTLFSIRDNVPAVEYNKIRLTAEKMILVDKELLDTNGDSVTYPVKLPGNNKIDLNPREPFTVRSGETVAIHLDMDAEKCIHIVKTGKDNKYQFRPVVFIKIINNIQLDELIRASGRVRDINLATSQFKLCTNNYTNVTDNDDGDSSRCCITVDVSRDTSFFDAERNGRAVDFGDLMEGDNVTVIGFYEEYYPSPKDVHGSCNMKLDAKVVEIGTFSKLKGTILESAVSTETVTSTTSEYNFLFAPGQGFGTGTEVKLVIQDDTKIYSSSQGAFLDEWTDEDILGKSAEIDGILLLSDSNPDTLVSAFILIDENAASSNKLSGKVNNINYRARTFDLVMSPIDTVCVTVPEDTDIILIKGLGSSEMIDFMDLYDGMNVDLYGGPDDGASDCFKPVTIIAFETG